MRNAGLEEAQAGIKIAGRNVNNLRYSNTNLPQKARKTSNKQPNLTPEATRKRRTTTTKPKVSRRKEIIKIKEK